MRNQKFTTYIKYRAKKQPFDISIVGEGVAKYVMLFLSCLNLVFQNMGDGKLSSFLYLN